MNGLILTAFITGLTAGGISCFAVQGGLITGSIARHLEGARAALPPAKKLKGKAARKQQRKAERLAKQRPTLQETVTQKGLAQSIGLFLLAKLTGYTLLGFLLGWLGSVVSLSMTAKGIMQILIGVFLVGNALRMFNMHPIFRFFNFEPPQAVTRYIRRLAKNSDGKWITPLYLGALTVLIPCGVTQSVMAVAIGTSNPLAGAAIMAAFVIGTSPAFFAVTMLAASLGRLFQKWFYPAVGVIVLLLGLYTVETGLNLMGSPFSISNFVRSAQASGIEAQPTQAGAAALPTDVTIEVGAYGYSPNQVTVPANQEVNLHMVTKEVWTCARSFYIPSLNLGQLLPPEGETVITIPPQPAGKRILFTCSMGMYTGVINVQ
jgi:sulfite exporter TauE/SafE